MSDPLATTPAKPPAKPATGDRGDTNGKKHPKREPVVDFDRWVFALSMIYFIVLIAAFVLYETWSTLRHNLPTSFGKLPAGVVWFGAIGAEIAALRGIFIYNHQWKKSFNYRYVARPVFGAVTGSIGALLYWVLLLFGSKSPPQVDVKTFFAVAFVFGFADSAFLATIKEITDVIIKPGTKASTKTSAKVKP